MTTAERILADLRAARPGSVCGSYWYANFTPTFAQRISIDIKPRGFLIESRICKKHEHKGTIHEYTLVYDTDRDEAERLFIAV